MAMRKSDRSGNSGVSSVTSTPRYCSDCRAEVITMWHRCCKSLLLALSLLALVCQAQPVAFELLSGADEVLFHYPGSDQLIGSADDIDSAAISDFLSSDPNAFASYSYLSFAVPGFAGGDPLLGGGNHAVFFLRGTFMIDESNTSNPISSATVTTTGYGQGVGAFVTTVNDVTGVTVNGGNIQADVDLDVELSALGVNIAFPQLLVDAGGSLGFCDPQNCASGIAYIDSVAAPVAASRGAARLAFLIIDGPIPDQNSVPLGVATSGRGVLIAASGMTQSTDLALAKTTATQLPVSPGQVLEYTLQLENQSSIAASGIVVTDVLPTDVAYLSNDCGAPAPVAGRFRWTPGPLGAGASSNCTINVQVSGQAIFDHVNAAVAYGDRHDPDLTNNIAGLRVDTISSATEGLVQLSDGATAIPADAHCSACPPAADGGVGVQTGAENFVVHEAFEIQQVVFQGFNTSGPSFSDDFTIEVHRDVENATLPGITGVPGDLRAVLDGQVLREGTGPIFTYRLTTRQTLTRGTWWITIRNDSSPSTADWAWISASADAQGRSRPNIAVNSLLPLNPRWTTTDNFRLALQLNGVARSELILAEGFE